MYLSVKGLNMTKFSRVGAMHEASVFFTLMTPDHRMLTVSFQDRAGRRLTRLKTSD